MAPRGESYTVAHAGTPPTPFPQVNACDFLFSEPFERSKQNDYVVPSQLVDRIAEDTPIYVDNATGELQSDALPKASCC